MNNEELVLKLRNSLIWQSVTLRQRRTQLMIARVSAVIFLAVSVLELVIIIMMALS